MLGVAIGAGNIWRFSRIVAQNGGGSFIIPWVIFLFLWSIPLIISEIGLGKLIRRAPIGTLAQTAGPSFGWMGAFIALVTTGILFYYSVVVGWGARYFLYSITGNLTSVQDHHLMWQNFIESFQPLYFHFGSVILGCLVIYKGITKGIEWSNKILMPTLFCIIIIIAIRALTLPGAWEGVSYLFTPHFEDLLDYRVWLEALTQNAWDTGSGWGLLLVYAGYAQPKESVTVNGSLAALGNNTISLIMGIIIFATAFALERQAGMQELISGEGSTNIGLTFIYLPTLFGALPGGAVIHTIFSSIFFLGFVFAAISSMISMLQLTSQIFNEMGMSRKWAIVLTGALALALGAPSALSMSFFENQDWVWSVGLIVNGLFIAFGIIRFGINRFREKAINSSPHDFKLGKFYNWFIGGLIPAQALILIGWYFYQSFMEMQQNWWNPLEPSSLGSLILQWGVALIVLICLNKKMVKKTLKETG